MTAKEEHLIKLLTISITELHVLLNSLKPGKFKEDAKVRIENLIAAIWTAQE